MNKKEIKIIGVIVGIMLVVIVGVLLIKNSKPKEVDLTIENEIGTQNVVLKDIEFSNITCKYENGITTIRAKMKNISNGSSNLKIRIILKDAEGNEIGNMMQEIENVEKGKEKILTTGVTGDYSFVTDTVFEVVK